MQNSSQKIAKTILTSLLGAILIGVSDSLWFYYASYEFPSGESGLGITFSRESNAQFGGFLGAILGVIFGGILGLIIGCFNLNRMQGTFAGVLVDGLLIVLLFGTLNVPSMSDLGAVYLCSGFVIGGVAGFIIAQVGAFLDKNAKKNLL